MCEYQKFVLSDLGKQRLEKLLPKIKENLADHIGLAIIGNEEREYGFNLSVELLPSMQEYIDSIIQPVIKEMKNDFVNK